MVSFDPGTATGTIRYRRYEYSTRIAFNNMLAVLNPLNANEFPGTWIDYQTGKEYAGGWHSIKAGEIPVVVLVKDGTAIPPIELAQSTKSMDWANIQLNGYSTKDTASGLLYTPGANRLETLKVHLQSRRYVLAHNPYGDDIVFNIEN